MFGVVLFVLILFFYGLVLSRRLIVKMIPANKSDETPTEGEEVKPTPGGFKGFMEKVNQFFENKGVGFMFSFAALVIGVWNLFAPDFGLRTHFVPTVIGALLPSLVMILDSAVLYPEIVEIFNIEKEKKDKYYEFVAKLADFMGIATLVFAFLHIFLNKTVFF